MEYGVGMQDIVIVIGADWLLRWKPQNCNNDGVVKGYGVGRNNILWHHEWLQHWYRHNIVVLMLSWMPIPLPSSGKLRTQKLKSHLLRTQSLKVPPLKPRVGQYIQYNTIQLYCQVTNAQRLCDGTKHTHTRTHTGHIKKPTYNSKNVRVVQRVDLIRLKRSD